MSIVLLILEIGATESTWYFNEWLLSNRIPRYLTSFNALRPLTEVGVLLSLKNLNIINCIVNLTLIGTKDYKVRLFGL